MHHWGRCLSIVAVSASLSACATPAPKMAVSMDRNFELPVKNVVVSDFTKSTVTSFSDGVWSSKFYALSDDATSPPFNSLVFNKLKNSFVGTQEADGDLEISLLSANILAKAEVADSVAIIGLFNAFSPRDHKCHLEVNVRHNLNSERVSLESVHTFPRLWGDTSVEKKEEMVESCLDNIFSDLQSYIALMI